MFKVSIIDIKTAEVVFSGMTNSVALPGQEGEFSLLDFHQSMVSCLQKGKVEVEGNPPLAIEKGISRMEGNELSILVER
ncbi:MAG: hypothetical protein U9Q08_04035 [Candidatus Omnitrophota bacterium]|nr:hypothetical protein [Candidatus Omnitrophota bacterium]